MNMSKSILSNIAIFAAGAAIGSVVTWKLVETKYKQIANEEINSVKEAFLKRDEKIKMEEDASEDEEDDDDDVIIPNTKPDLSEYKDLVKSYGYNKEEEEVKNVKQKPYVIEPEAFGDDDYDIISLTYYADGVVTDEMDEVLDDDEVENQIGKDSLTHFGEYEDDSVFVRNEKLHTDYEILADTRNYHDLYPQKVEES